MGAACAPVVDRWLAEVGVGVCVHLPERMRMGKALTWIGGILLAVLSLLLVVPHLVDWNRYRGMFEEEASRALGREVRVGGGVNLRLLPSPYVRFEKLRIADTAGTLGEPFFRAESFTMGLSVAPLLRGALEATEIELQSPTLTLAIDGEGRGNWRDVALAPAAALLPAEVRLKSVNVIDGQLTVKGRDGPLVQLNAINGEISADNLTGPYKFRGSLAKDGTLREVRFSTAEPDPDYAVRFKASVRAPATDAIYALDGKLIDIGGKPRIEGEATARIPLASAGGSPRNPAERDNLEMRSRIEGDVFGVSFPDIALTFEQGAQPQLIGGDATVSWRDTLRVKVALASKWLDLDRIAATGAEAGPAAAVKHLVPALVSLLPESGQVDARMAVDLVTLGGEAVSAARLHLERFRGPMLVRELQAALPGGAKLDLTGTLALQGADASFNGDLSVRGSSHARFLGWAAKGQTLLDTRNDGPFSVQGRLALSPTGLEIGALSAEVGGAPPLTGAVAYTYGPRRKLDLRLEGSQLDVSPLIPGGLHPARAKELLWPTSVAKADTSPGLKLGSRQGLLASFDPATTDARVVVRANELGDGERIYRDVDAAITLENGRLQIAHARLTTDEGLRLDIEGELTGLGKEPKGALRGLLDATSAEAAGSLLSLLDLASGSQGKARDALLERLSPLRLAGTIRLGERTPSSTGVALDGLIKGSRAIVRLDLDAGPSRWRDGAISGAIRIAGADAALAVSEAFLGDSRDTAAARSLRGGGLTLDITGHPRNGILATASLKGEGLSLTFDGRIADPAGKPRDVEGTVRVDAQRLEPVLSLMGLGAVASLRDSTASGTVELSSNGDALRLKSRGLTVAGTDVAGQMAMTRPPNAPAAIDAALYFAKADVAGLLAPVVDRRPRTGREAQDRTGEAGTIWPDHPFDLAALDAVQGRIRLSMGSLSLAPGLALADASLDAELSPGQIKITNLDGRALGGELKARLVLEKAPMAGAALAGALRIDDARLEALAGKSAATGAAGLLMQFSARALTPQALVLALQGKGEISLGASQLRHHSPSAVPQTIDAVLDAKVDAGGEALRKALREGLAASPVKLPATKLGLQIADGAVKIQRLDFATEDARGSVETTVELGSMKVDSEWRLEPKGPPKRVLASQSANKSALPGISLVYVGPLGSVAALEPRMNTEALERVLTVLRMERDVEELERLRREDEERIRLETERQKALEEERKKAVEDGRALPDAASPVAAPASVPAATGSWPAPQVMGPSAPPAPPPRFEMRPAQQPASGSSLPLAQSPSASGGPSAQAVVPAAPAAAPDAAPPQGAVPSGDAPKRPARMGPPRPGPAAQPKFNPFSAPGFGTN